MLLERMCELMDIDSPGGVDVILIEDLLERDYLFAGVFDPGAFHRSASHAPALHFMDQRGSRRDVRSPVLGDSSVNETSVRRLLTLNLGCVWHRVCASGVVPSECVSPC